MEQKDPTLEQIINSLELDSQSEDSLNAIFTLFTLDEDKFEVVAPIVYDNLEKSLKSPDVRLNLIKTMTDQGLSATTFEESFGEILAAIKENEDIKMSTKKYDFLSSVISLICDAARYNENLEERIVTIPIQVLNGAKIPEYAHITDSGADVYATEDIVIKPGETKLIPTGIKVAIPEGYEIQVRPKSGRSLKTKLRIANTPGTIKAF